jgi:translation initiation factor IF-1
MIKRTLPVMGSMLLIAAMALPCMGQDQGAAGQPGGQAGGQKAQAGDSELKASDLVTAKATVESVDKAKRTVTLKGEDGKTVTAKVGKNVQNFDQIKKGDQVKAAYYESAAISIRKPGDPPAATGEKQVVMAPEAGEKPGMVEIRTAQAAATIDKVDAQKQEVTITGPQGQEKTIKVKGDTAKDLDRLQKGDQVVVRFTEAFAVKVEPE